MKKKIWLVMGMTGVLLFGGCGSKAALRDVATESYKGWDNGALMDTAEDYYYSKSESAAEAPSVPDRGNGSLGFSEENGLSAETQLYNTESEKLIRTVSMQLQTKEFETLLSYLEGKVAELGGYIQSSQIYGNSMDSYGYRSAAVTFRIPQNKLDLFISGVSENSTVVRKSENAENVTLKYADTEARLKSLKIEQERFLELLEKADTVESILVLEEHLTELRYEIESYASALKVYDNKVNYSTVSLDISEVKRIAPVEQNPTLLTRMKDGFTNTWYRMKDGAADLLVWIVTNFLYLLIWGVILVAAVVMVGKMRKKRKACGVSGRRKQIQHTDEEQNDGMDIEK